MLNEVHIEGTICGKEKPELRVYPSGDKYFRFSIAWIGKLNGRDMKGYYSIVLNGKLAEDFEDKQVWKRGQTVTVTGALNSWASKEGKRYTDIICQKLQLGRIVEWKGPKRADEPKAPLKEKAPQVPDGEKEIDYTAISDDDKEIPF